LDVNGERRQDGNTSQMIWPVPALVAHVSRWMTLERGDLLFTGTPAGVSPLVPGDRLAARLEKVATLELTVEAEDSLAT
jgi:2-keto-4-pentenoate hydratase/2-oxohepta-3-ene-1,7-dioic acid hydratase in catechol pathway